MKNRFSFLALLLALTVFAAACGGDDAEETTTTAEAETTTTTEAAMEEDTSVLDLAIEAGQFSTLIAAIDAAGLAETLEGEGPFTVLAPTDAAFEEAFAALGITPEALLADTDTLTQILTYHVLPVAADSQLVASLDGQGAPTVNGEEVMINVVDGQVMVDEATVVSADLAADNGIVHVINGVLLPSAVASALGVAGAEQTTTTTTTTTAAPEEPTIAAIVADLASADPAEFTILLAALETAGLVDALNNPGDELTVFAPTDEAFGNLLAALDVTPEELLARDDLADILLYHVAPGVFDATTVVGAVPIEGLETLNSAATLNIDVVDGSVVINGESTVIQPDVFASNGVIHVIDTVLIPAS